MQLYKMLREFNSGISKEQKKFHRRKEDFHFINIDLEIKSLENLQPIVDELGEKVSILYNDMPPNREENWLSMEVAGDYEIYENYNDETDDIGGVDVLLTAFCDLLENLSAESKNLWNSCRVRSFDVGFACGNTEKSYHTTIKTETLQRVAQIGATIHITVYPFVNYTIKYL